jgi:hypothetical protein
VRSVLVLLLVTAVTIATPIAAGESLAAAAKTHAVSPSTPFCTQLLIANDEVGTTEPDCFATGAQALAYATGDSSLAALSATEAREVLDNPSATLSRAVTASAATTLLGTDYWDTHYGGNYYLWYANDSCSPYFTFYVPTMPTGWNDKVSSARSYLSGGCAHYYHYKDAGYGGGSIDCGYSAGCYDMYLPDGSSMSDRTSTEIFRS